MFNRHRFYDLSVMTLVVVSVIEDLVMCYQSEEGLIYMGRRRKPPSLNPTPRIRPKYVMPTMIILQLDLTIWPFMVDMQVTTFPVFKTAEKHTIRDPTGRIFRLYPEVTVLLDNLERRFFKLAAISQSTHAERVEILLEKFDIQQYFMAWEIMPGPKTLHVKRLHERTNVPYEEMLYIDSDTADIPAIKDLNVTCYLLQEDEDEGLTPLEMEDAFFEFYRKRPTPVPITPSRRRRASRASRRKTTTNPHTMFVEVELPEYVNDSISLSSASVKD